MPAGSRARSKSGATRRSTPQAEPRPCRGAPRPRRRPRMTLPTRRLFRTRRAGSSSRPRERPGSRPHPATAPHATPPDWPPARAGRSGCSLPCSGGPASWDPLPRSYVSSGHLPSAHWCGHLVRTSCTLCTRRIGAGRLEAGPQVRHRVRAPGPPGMRGPLDLTGPIVAAEGSHRVAHSEVAGQHHVRITQPSHRDVGRGPRPDPRAGLQVRSDPGPVDARIEYQVTISEGSTDAHERGSPRPRHRKPGRVGISQPVDGREDVGQRGIGECERLAVCGDESPQHGRRPRQADLLAATIARTTIS